jgi:ankyrin repeat protein
VNRKFRGEKPLRWAVQGGHLKIIKRLIDKGADPTEPDSEGMTPLDVAAGEGHKNIVKYLLKYGVDVNQESDGGTALHKACAYGEFEIARLLIDAGADLKKKDDEGRTVRYYAKHFRHIELLQLIDNTLHKNKRHTTTKLRQV